MLFRTFHRPQKTLLVLLATVLFNASCLRDNFETDRLSERINYSPHFVMPIAYGSLTLGNLLKPDDTLIFVDPDNSIRLVLKEDSLFSISAADILSIPLPGPVISQFIPKPARLDDLVAYTSINLDEITRRINEPEASQIRDSEGSIIEIPEIPWQDAGSVTADFGDDLDYALFATGELELSVHNDLPVNVSMDIRLVNYEDGGEVATFFFKDIKPGESASQSTSLDNVEAHRNIKAEITGFGTTSKEALVDLSDEIRFELNARELSVVKGRARIEETLIDNIDALRDLPFGDEVQLDELKISDGLVYYTIENFPEGVTLEVTLVNVLRNGIPETFYIIPEGDNGVVDGVQELSDLEFDFSKYDKQIMFEVRLFAGQDGPDPVEFDLTGETINVDIRCSDLNAKFISGYFGMEEIELDMDELDLDMDIFDKITGDFRLANPSVTLFYNNSAGVPAKFFLGMNASSASGDNHIDLFDNGLQHFSVNYPGEPYTSVKDEIVINKEISNIVDLIALPPSTINIDASVIINPDGPEGPRNFITSESEATFGLEFNLPLEMQLTDLGFEDTLAIDIESGDIDMIEKLFMNLQVTNGFPLGAAIDLCLYDSHTDQLLDSFENMVLIEAAEVDGGGLAIDGGEAKSESGIEITGKTRDDLVRADHIIISARLNTGKHNGAQVPVKFQTTNSLDFRIRISADLNISN